ncbi:hypothetical protein NE865_00853 [Phthorimaea operculella]|nr:hypothetical protein NE865_00853 [Phthorimaea operculella]
MAEFMNSVSLAQSDALAVVCYTPNEITKMPPNNAEIISKAVKSAILPLETKISALVTIINDLKSEILNLKSNSTNNTVPARPQVDSQQSSYAAALETTPTAPPKVPEDKGRNKRVAAEAALAKLTKNKTNSVTKPQKNGSKIDNASKQNSTPKLNQSTRNNAEIPGATSASDESAPPTPNLDSDDMGSFVTHTNKARQRNQRRATSTSSIVSGSAKNTQLQGIEQVKYLHACYFRKNTSADDLIQYLKSIKDECDFSAEIIPSKHDNYASFKVGVPAAFYDELAKPAVWPINTRIAPWRPFLYNKGRGQQQSNPPLARNRAGNN